MDNEVIEQAAKVIRPLVDTIYGCAIDGGYMPPDQGETWMPVADRIARALAEAGLLNPWSSVEEEQVRAERAEAEVAELRATVDRVRAIHEPIDAVMNPGPRERIVKVCTGCGTDDGNWQRWPCPTVRALDGAGEQ